MQALSGKIRREARLLRAALSVPACALAAAPVWGAAPPVAGTLLNNVAPAPAQAPRPAEALPEAQQRPALKLDVSTKIPIAARLSTIKPGEALSGPDLERSLLLLSDLPGMRVRSTLSPGASVGTTDLDKTRLAYEVARYARRRGLAIWLRCGRETTHEPLAPLRGWIGALAGAAPGEPRGRAIRRLARIERRWGTNELMTELFAPEGNGEPGGLAATPASLRGTFARLLGFAAGAARGRGLFVVVDDIQWADQTTLELLSQWLHGMKGRAFTLLLAREADNVPAGVPILEPPRLDDDAARELLRVASPHRAITREEVEAGLRLAEGLPLFLVELKRHWAGTVRHGLDLPRNLHDLLAARLDHLQPKLRRLAGIAAVLGNEGDVGQLSRLAREAPEQLLPQLARFVEAGLVFPLEHDRYCFRHQALHRAALERLPADERRALHARAAGELADVLPPARVAWHWELAGQPAKALLAHIVAGRQAFLEGAQREAVSHFDSALMLGAQHATQTATMLSAWIGKGLALIELEGYASLAASDCFGEAKELAESSVDLEMRLQVEWGFWLPSSSRVGHHGALDWVHVRIGKTAELQAIEAMLEVVNVAMPSAAAIFLAPYMDALRHLGRYDDALSVFDQAMAIVRRYRDRQVLDTLWRLRAACLDGLGGREAEAQRCRRRAQRVRACQLQTSRELDESYGTIDAGVS